MMPTLEETLTALNDPNWWAKHFQPVPMQPHFTQERISEMLGEQTEAEKMENV